MYGKDRPEPRERHASIRVKLPIRLIERLRREAEAIASPLLPPTQARDALTADLIEAGFARLSNATRCSQP